MSFTIRVAKMNNWETSKIEKDCVWEITSSDGVDGRSISDIETCKIEERRQPTCPELRTCFNITRH